MKYFLDTEFIEGFHRPLFSRRRHFIDLISIGIVAEDGREYYAISNEFDERKASDWVWENVIKKLEYAEPFEFSPKYVKVYEGMQAVRKAGKSNKQIAKEIIEFVNPGWLGLPVSKVDQRELSEHSKEWVKLHNAKPFDIEDIFDCYFAQPEFYGYYADYDWIVFCSLFGRMIDLPKGFPMYCRDLKQMLDEAAENWPQIVTTTTLPVDFNPNPSFEEKLTTLKKSEAYPKQTNEHNALADAKWNFELYKFLQRP